MNEVVILTAKENSTEVIHGIISNKSLPTENWTVVTYDFPVVLKNQTVLCILLFDDDSKKFVKTVLSI